MSNVKLIKESTLIMVEFNNIRISPTPHLKFPTTPCIINICQVYFAQLCHVTLPNEQALTLMTTEVGPLPTALFGKIFMISES